MSAINNLSPLILRSRANHGDGIRIAIFDYKITKTNPIGSCHHRLIEALCGEYEFTVFAPEFDNPCPQRVRYVHVPVPRRPLALLYVTFHLIAPILYFIERMRRGRFQIVQVVESNLLLQADVDYVHFCHRGFLRHHWAAVKRRGLRSKVRFLDHWLHARLEPLVFSRARQIRVPSHGAARELAAEYPAVKDKIQVLSNPVDINGFQRPDNFDRALQRHAAGAGDGDTLMVFVALGHFERKGLTHILKAMRAIDRPDLKLVVVGGQKHLIDLYRRRVNAMALTKQVSFAGMQDDVRPWLWAADVFVFPSAYETFSLVSFQAAAAGLPLIVTHLYGVEEFADDGQNSVLVEKNQASLRQGIERFLALSSAQRIAMGERGRHDVRPFSTDRFIAAWRSVYAEQAVANPN